MAESNPTRTKRQEKTVELTHMEVLKLISPEGRFWYGCPCDSCEGLRVKLAAKWPTLAHDLAAKVRSS